MTKLASSLPDSSDNGLEVIAHQLVNDPHAQHLIVAVVDCKQTTIDNDSGEHVPTARIRRVEVIQDEIDRDTVARLLVGRHDQRTGRDSLFSDLEKAVAAITGAKVSVIHKGRSVSVSVGGDTKDSGQAPA